MSGHFCQEGQDLPYPQRGLNTCLPCHPASKPRSRNTNVKKTTAVTPTKHTPHEHPAWPPVHAIPIGTIIGRNVNTRKASSASRTNNEQNIKTSSPNQKTNKKKKGYQTPRVSGSSVIPNAQFYEYAVKGVKHMTCAARDNVRPPPETVRNVEGVEDRYEEAISTYHPLTLTPD